MNIPQKSVIYGLAEQASQNIEDPEKIEEKDLTNIFWEELEMMIKQGEIIIVNINAKMRLGKSVLAFAIANKIHDLLKKYEQQPKNAQFGIKHLARDQQEFAKLMRDPNLKNTVIVTDESNAMETTGENTSVETKLAQMVSDVQAARYVHRVCYYYCVF